MDKPNQFETALSTHLQTIYGLDATTVHPLDLGADFDARVYRIDTASREQSYFLKLKTASAVVASVAIPHFLSSRGIGIVVAAVPTRGGELTSMFEGLQLVVYPFIEGETAMDTGLTENQWIELGAALKAIHTVALPNNLATMLAPERFPAEPRRLAESFLHAIRRGDYDSVPGAKLAQLLQSHEPEIRHIIKRADELAEQLTADGPRPLMITHGDLHKWNIQVRPDGSLIIVDWDDIKLAPKERDLMFIGGNIGGDTGDELEESAFYHGYGSDAQVDPVALAYYRYQRIVIDIVEYCRELWETPGISQEDSEEIVSIVASQFERGNVLETALLTDKLVG